MHVKAKTVALGGLLLALTIVFMALGSVIETSTLFLLAAASFFVGIVIREFWRQALHFTWRQCCWGSSWRRINSMYSRLRPWDSISWGSKRCGAGS